MSELLKRLTRLTRAYLGAWRATYSDKAPSSESTSTTWEQETAFGTRQRASEETAGAQAEGSLPYSDELARCYALLDLPFGVPLAQVTRRWKTYLKQCHPDRYATEPDKVAAATELTQMLTKAYETIKAAWQHQQSA